MTGEHTPNKSVEDLMRRLFGNENFDQFINETPRSSDNKASLDTHQDSPEAQPELPQPEAPQPDPNNQVQVPGQQPQQPDSGMMPNMNPTNPMPPKPAGASMGMF